MSSTRSFNSRLMQNKRYYSNFWHVFDILRDISFKRMLFQTIGSLLTQFNLIHQLRLTRALLSFCGTRRPTAILILSPTKTLSSWSAFFVNGGVWDCQNWSNFQRHLTKYWTFKLVFFFPVLGAVWLNLALVNSTTSRTILSISISSMSRFIFG